MILKECANGRIPAKAPAEMVKEAREFRTIIPVEGCGEACAIPDQPCLTRLSDVDSIVYGTLYSFFKFLWPLYLQWFVPISKRLQSPFQYIGATIDEQLEQGEGKAKLLLPLRSEK